MEKKVIFTRMGVNYLKRSFGWNHPDCIFLKKSIKRPLNLKTIPKLGAETSCILRFFSLKMSNLGGFSQKLSSNKQLNHQICKELINLYYLYKREGSAVNTGASAQGPAFMKSPKNSPEINNKKKPINIDELLIIIKLSC